MFFSDIFLVVSLMTFLRDFHVSSCDTNCTDRPEFTPTRLVVKHGDPTSAICSVCQHACLDIGTIYDLEKVVGDTSINGTTILWTVDRLTEWQSSPICYYSNAAYQCCSSLHVTVYQPPDSVSFSFVNHTGPMLEGHQYTLQCTVQDVAPVENLSVTFYRGQTALGQLQSNNTEKKPVTEIFSLNITPSKEDDGVQFWCEAKLELGPDGPQRPPVVTSENITATVHYKPQLKSSSSDLITVSEGNSLQLNCSAVGNPRPSYTWTSPIRSYSNGSFLTIDSVTSADKGQYTCSVSNHVGTATVKFDVDVKESYIGLIVGVIAAVALLVVICVVIGYLLFYKPNRMGQYNLKDVFRLHTKHSAVPSVEYGTA
ncbi:cell adhesion molecule 4-like isoform X1 [Sander lucioperca]|uniref:cell adhesion molecule 4-like isoform X1 n=1 Tax=Sander lucioperca TaxID=283035 RepID=UPI00125D7608|nr:cell adhesion molecule 4-like isoform X1 [Sander lucioperca]